MSTPSRAGLTIERIEDPARFTALREEWDKLLASSAADCIFLTWEWLHTWWNHLAAGRRLRLITFRSEGRLVGLLPLSVSPPQWRRLIPFSRCEFLGAGSVGSDYLDVIVRGGWERYVLKALSRYLAENPSMLELAQVNRESSLANHGAERYKLHWARQSRQLERLDLYPPRFHGYRTVMRAGGALRRVARKLVPATVADRVASATPHAVDHTSNVRHSGHR